MSNIHDEHEHIHDERCMHPVPEAQTMAELRKGESLYQGAHGFHMKLSPITYKGKEYEAIAIHDAEHNVLAFCPNLEQARHLLSLYEAEMRGMEVLAELAAEQRPPRRPGNIRDLRN